MHSNARLRGCTVRFGMAWLVSTRRGRSWSLGPPTQHPRVTTNGSLPSSDMPPNKVLLTDGRAGAARGRSPRRSARARARSGSRLSLAAHSLIEPARASSSAMDPRAFASSMGSRRRSQPSAPFAGAEAEVCPPRSDPRPRPRRAKGAPGKRPRESYPPLPQRFGGAAQRFGGAAQRFGAIDPALRGNRSSASGQSIQRFGAIDPALRGR
jgi:hypothetical protein